MLYYVVQCFCYFVILGTKNTTPDNKSTSQSIYILLDYCIRLQYI